MSEMYGEEGALPLLLQAAAQLEALEASGQPWLEQGGLVSCTPPPSSLNSSRSHSPTRRTLVQPANQRLLKPTASSIRPAQVPSPLAPGHLSAPTSPRAHLLAAPGQRAHGPWGSPGLHVGACRFWSLPPSPRLVDASDRTDLHPGNPDKAADDIADSAVFFMRDEEAALLNQQRVCGHDAVVPQPAEQDRVNYGPQQQAHDTCGLSPLRSASSSFTSRTPAVARGVSPSTAPSGAKRGGQRGARCKVKKPTSSAFKGVTLHRRSKKWEGHVWTDGRQMYLGSFGTQGQAARAHDIMSVKCKGLKGGQLNFSIAEYLEVDAMMKDVSKDEVLWALRHQQHVDDAETATLNGCATDVEATAAQFLERVMELLREGAPEGGLPRRRAGCLDNMLHNMQATVADMQAKVQKVESTFDASRVTRNVAAVTLDSSQSGASAGAPAVALQLPQAPQAQPESSLLTRQLRDNRCADGGRPLWPPGSYSLFTPATKLDVQAVHRSERLPTSADSSPKITSKSLASFAGSIRKRTLDGSTVASRNLQHVESLRSDASAVMNLLPALQWEWSTYNAADAAPASTNSSPLTARDTTSSVLHMDPEPQPCAPPAPCPGPLAGPCATGSPVPLFKGATTLSSMTGYTELGRYSSLQQLLAMAMSTPRR